jgi:hypothetical protein
VAAHYRVALRKLEGAKVMSKIRYSACADDVATAGGDPTLVSAVKHVLYVSDLIRRDNVSEMIASERKLGIDIRVLRRRHSINGRQFPYVDENSDAEYIKGLLVEVLEDALGLA